MLTAGRIPSWSSEGVNRSRTQLIYHDTDTRTESLRVYELSYWNPVQAQAEQEALALMSQNPAMHE